MVKKAKVRVPAAALVPPDEPEAADPGPCQNAVLLVGALIEPAERRELAGGVPVVRWTLRVPRGEGQSGSDLLDCVALDDDLQQRALSWPVGLPVSVSGAIRRRFFRTGGRTTTRVEIEAQSAVEIDQPSTPEMLGAGT